jgi:hypothetical protein
MLAFNITDATITNVPEETHIQVRFVTYDPTSEWTSRLED